MKKFRKNEKGFTLIEALIVVIIIAILAALGIARFLGVREATAEATCISHLSTLNAAIKKWQLENPTLVGTTDLTSADVAADTAAAGDIYTDAGRPTCPSGGIYGFAAAAGGADEYIATCDQPGHVIPMGT